MSEVARLRGILNRKRLEREKAEIRFSALLKELRYTLTPYEDLRNLDLSRAQRLLSDLVDIQNQVRELDRDIRNLERDLEG